MTKKKHRWIFPVALLAYALVFLVALVFGLSWFWDYMDAYEQSRPHIALNAYMEQLTAEYVADASGALIGKIDHNVQTEEECRQVILAALSGNFTCAKKSRESDEDRHVYAIRCGTKVIGTMEMERCGQQMQGFTAWEVTGDSFDLSYLMTEPVSVSVPENYPVYSLGKRLGSGYITEEKIPYTLLTDLYEDYTLPYMVTYTAGPFLGEVALTVTDPAGNPVTVDDNTDPTVFLNNCTTEEIAALDTAVAGYIQSYVDFMSRTGGDTYANYTKLKQHILPGGTLDKRMQQAMEGLKWVTDRGAQVSSITTHNYVNMGDGRYLCDVTYAVDTRDYGGSLQTTASVKLILLKTADGLRTEAMKSS